jgi:hypothetical protein
MNKTVGLPTEKFNRKNAVRAVFRYSDPVRKAVSAKSGKNLEF